MKPAPILRRSSGHSSAMNVPPIGCSPPRPMPQKMRRTASCQTFCARPHAKVKNEYIEDRHHQRLDASEPIRDRSPHHRHAPAERGTSANRMLP